MAILSAERNVCSNCSNRLAYAKLIFVAGVVKFSRHDHLSYYLYGKCGLQAHVCRPHLFLPPSW